ISFYRHVYGRTNGEPGKKLPTVNVTIQNTISAQALDTYNHSFGSTIGGGNSTFMRNLWANNAGRNPSIGMGGGFNFINNVVYNWVHRSADGGGAPYNFINNYYKPGPLTPKNTPAGHRILKPEGGRNGFYGKVYATGNIMEGYPEITADNWAGGIQIQEQANTDGYTEQMKVDQPFPIKNPFPIMGAQEAYNFVLDNVGATFPKRDLVDEHIINQVRTGEVYYNKDVKPEEFYQFEHRRLPADSYKYGIITNVKQVGGYPEYRGTPYEDSDNDGMPDAWEKKYGLNPNDPSDAVKDLNGDGYTNIEKYINGIDPVKKTDWTKPENNHDTLQGKKSLM
ncbi:MAG: thrombospondin type 3 repeat-containing protein, partial [Dysgonamonadaceae bacterium]|nr:thrombospondin type 3 repeat-containing protein [Dysgonamonadaceae bacterium]